VAWPSWPCSAGAPQSPDNPGAGGTPVPRFRRSFSRVQILRPKSRDRDDKVGRPFSATCKARHLEFLYFLAATKLLSRAPVTTPVASAPAPPESGGEPSAAELPSSVEEGPSVVGRTGVV
jgi:hypothetical protein